AYRPPAFDTDDKLENNAPRKDHLMHLKELKKKTPAELVAMSEEMGVEGASTMRKQDLMFSILKIQAENGVEIMGSGTIEVLNDEFGFIRSTEANYIADTYDI